MNLKLFYLTFILSISIINAQINWQNGQPTGTSWAMACDFKGSDLTNKRIAGADCSSACASTFGCTHFTWTSYNGGICWMKSGIVLVNLMLFLLEINQWFVVLCQVI